MKTYTEMPIATPPENGTYYLVIPNCIPLVGWIIDGKCQFPGATHYLKETTL